MGADGRIQDPEILNHLNIVSIDQLTILGWTTTVLSVLLTMGRLIIHWRKVHSLTLDDLLNTMSAILLIPLNITCLIYLPVEVQAQSYALGLTDKMPTFEQLNYSNHVELAMLFLFWFVIYLVKASFLALFWRLFNISSRFRMWWCGITIFTALSFCVTILMTLWRCGNPSDILTFGACETMSIGTARAILIIWSVLNSIGGIVLMSLPVYMVNTRMLALETPQRVGITLIFGLVVVHIIFDILRTVYALSPDLGVRTNLLAVWLILEPNVAVIVCALPHYKGMLSCGNCRKARGSSSFSFTKSRSSARPQTIVPMDLQDVSGYCLESRSTVEHV
ncbi:hypothetical protein BU24DRAFT_420434 [Aaosphaeria arxii CBS 175.79]|uniref:Rhodopsin domain-containing protein n=1 Tax=Aaosphaeria arxii CBS 175.79 TaxID=1450172 RepID=A0A6A5XYN0_9PLEO|nr:uncharacterized protein BU24DRAFT_420434 [Aaosphaeria arxii CBS 175.79]KAF2017384.1 hypothetical protein BU24DRAFT_420434 [Aaosphaeria arxii CBS 175.79]